MNIELTPTNNETKNITANERDAIINEFADSRAALSNDIEAIQSGAEKALPKDKRRAASELTTHEDWVEDLKVTPGFLRSATHKVHERAAIREKNDRLAELENRWTQLGGQAVEAAQQSVDQLNFKSNAEDHIRAKKALSFAKDAFIESILAEKVSDKQPDESENAEKNDIPTLSAVEDALEDRPHLEPGSPVIVKRSNGDVEEDGWFIAAYPYWSSKHKKWMAEVRKPLSYDNGGQWMDKTIPVDQLLEWQRLSDDYHLGKDAIIRVPAFKKEGDKSVYDPTIPPVIFKGRIVGISPDGSKFDIMTPDSTIQQNIPRKQLDSWKTVHIHDRSDDSWKEWTITDGPDNEGWVRLSDGSKDIVRHRASLELWSKMYDDERRTNKPIITRSPEQKTITAEVEKQMQAFIAEAPKTASSTSETTGAYPLSEKTRRRLKKFEKITHSPGFAKQFEKDSASIRRMFVRRKAKLALSNINKLAKDSNKRQAKRKR